MIKSKQDSNTEEPNQKFKVEMTDSYIFDKIKCLIVIADLHSQKILYLNHPFIEQLGYNPIKKGNITLKDLYDPKERKIITELLQPLISKEIKSITLVSPIISSKNKIIPVETHLNIGNYENHEAIIGVGDINPNIDELLEKRSLDIVNSIEEEEYTVPAEKIKKKKWKMRASASILKKFIDSNPYPIAVFNGDGSYYSGNTAFIDLFVVEPLKNYNIFTDPIMEEKGIIEESLNELRAGLIVKIPDTEYDISIIDPNVKKIVNISVMLFPIFDFRKKLSRLVVIFENLTHIKKSAKIIKESEDKYKNLFESSAVGIGIVKNEKIVEINPAMEKLIGYTKDEIHEFDFHTHYVNQDQFEEIGDLLQKNGRIDNFEIELYRKNREKYWALFSSHVIHIDNEDFYLTTEFDITKRKIAEMELDKQKQTNIEKELDIQYSTVISMISTFFIHMKGDLGDTITDSIKTLGNSLNCELIMIFQHVFIRDKQHLKLKWTWTSNGLQNYIDENGTAIEKYGQKIFDLGTLPLNIYQKISRKEIDTKGEPQFEMLLNSLKIENLLITPIFIGEKRYGTMMISYKESTRDFQHREVSLSLQTSILIGMALNNYFSNQYRDNFFNALSQLNIGAFMIQTDQLEEAKFVFVNPLFSKILGYTNKELYEMTSISKILYEEDYQIIKRAYYEKFTTNMEIPSMFNIKMKGKDGDKMVKISLKFGELSGKVTAFGIIFDAVDNSIKYLKDFFTN
jgi:PAS domain S-box-containing protein